MDPIVAERGRTAAMAAELAPPAPLATPGTRGARGAIELRGLTKRYGEETVVNAIAVSIAPAEFFSLLGPSGSGKTTTLMMAAGFVRPDSGTVLLDGQDIAAIPPQKRGFGMVFQNYAIFPQPECLREHRLSATCATLGERRNRRAGDLGARTGAARPLRGPRRAAGSSSASPWRARSSSTRPSC